MILEEDLTDKEEAVEFDGDEVDVARHDSIECRGEMDHTVARHDSIECRYEIDYTVV